MAPHWKVALAGRESCYLAVRYTLKEVLRYPSGDAARKGAAPLLSLCSVAGAEQAAERRLESALERRRSHGGSSWLPTGMVVSLGLGCCTPRHLGSCVGLGLAGAGGLRWVRGKVTAGFAGCRQLAEEGCGWQRRATEVQKGFVVMAVSRNDPGVLALLLASLVHPFHVPASIHSICSSRDLFTGAVQILHQLP